MSKRRRSQQGSSEEEGEEEEHRRNSYPARVTMSTKNKTLLPGIQPPFLTYGASGGIQGVFCAMPMQPFPFSSVSSSVPFMPLPPQMFYTAAAGSPYGSQPLPILTGAGPGSAFLYPQLAAASQAAYISAQGKSPTSPPVETHANKQESPEDEEQSGGESPVIAVATPSVTNASSGNEQLLLASQNQTLMYRIATQGQDPLRYPSQAMMPLGQSSRIPGTEATTAALSASSEDKKLTLVPSDVSLTSGSASVVSRLIAQKNKQPLANSQKPKTLKKLLTGATKLQEDPLYAELQDEPHFVNFLRFFASNERSKHLRLRLLKTEGSGVLKWIEVSLKASHIDASIGPVDVARILLSSNGLCKLQILFPYFTTVFTKFVPTNQEEADDLLGELSVNHILCPGLPNYEDKFAVLGYHPSHVRAMETSSLKRYDHDKCPLWHVPSNLFSKSGHLMHNMCKQCRNLQANLVRQATKACEIDPRERESWTDPSSHRPLAFMSAADKEERYRKLRQERTQMLVKLKAYEEQLGNVSVSSRKSSFSESQGDSTLTKPAKEMTTVQKLLEKQLMIDTRAAPPPDREVSSVEYDDSVSGSEGSSTTSSAPMLKDLIRSGRRGGRGKGRGRTTAPAVVPSHTSKSRSRKAKRKSSLTVSEPGGSVDFRAEEVPPKHKARRLAK